VIRLLLAYSGVLFCGSTGAFFLFVPPLWIATVGIALVVLPLAAFVLLDFSGIHVELHAVPPSEDINRKN